MRIRKLVTFVVLLLFAVLAAVPFVWLIRSSLMRTDELFVFPPKIWPEQLLWHNYVDVFSMIPFALYFKNTMFIMVPVMLGVVITSSMCGYGFARLRFPFQHVWFALILSTMMLPSAVTLIPTFIMWSELKAVNTFWPLTLPAWFGGGAFNIFLMRQFFMNIPKELDESALIDGAVFFQIYTRIMLPLVKPALIVVAFFTFMNVWNDFFSPLIFLNEDAKYTLALGLLQLKGMYATEWNLLMAGSAIMVLPAIAIFFIGQKYFIEGISLTGIKG
ncbi:carbohydrate ABC transporter permease [Paenibacillus nasutitermitis]|uniref:Sugar ABC transporter permease n=1 Tax=Paenibacillus nasutitermitis TaxID=1652958 RepID=A0A916YIV1_9BACL|nr:carbohydrate ABC transporter permease [Paenibacillus nasutitermitis]GGD46900.1 sugar ABC transporter permease [Paenibacillus nasutitermitis]